MILQTSLLIVFISFAMSKPHYIELDEDDQELFRSAYDTPSYLEDCEDDDDFQPGQTDLVKDTLWALKAKMKELKALNKALTANLLITKLKLKEFVMNKMLAKKLKKSEVENKKYQQYEIYGPQYPQYAAIPYGHDPYLGM